MAIEGDIQTLLAALVSGRCYPLTAPDPVTKPYIIYQAVSEVPQNSLDGATGLNNRRMQVDVYDTSYGATKTLAGSIKTAMAGAPFNNLHLSSQDLYENDTKLYRVTMDFSVWSE
jgi:hypothetical protein